MIDRRLIQNFDWGLLGIILLLMGFGIVALYSAVMGDSEGIQRFLYYKQMIWYGLGLIVMIVAFAVDYKSFNEWAYVIYGLSLILLIAVLFMGKVGGGARRWLILGPVFIQPSEFAKLGLIFVLARYYSKRVTPEGLTLLDLIFPIILTAIPIGLILKQPDLGTAMLYVLIAASMTVYAKIERKSFIFLATTAIIAMPLLWFHLKDYQKQRIFTFLNPEMDPLGAGYHIIQSKIAIGSGMLSGRGMLSGTQNLLSFLPEQHTDFIFSVFSEAWGFMGSISLILCFIFLILWAFYITFRCKTGFGIFLSFGITVMIFWQVFVNIGMVMGLMPVVGIPLPLVSYGGSSVMTTMIGMGLLLNISMRRFLIDL